VKRGL